MSTGHASPETHRPPNHFGRRSRGAPEWAQSSAPPVDTSTAAVGMQQPQLKWLTTAYRGLLFWSQGYLGDAERAPAPRATRARSQMAIHHRTQQAVGSQSQSSAATVRVGVAYEVFAPFSQ